MQNILFKPVSTTQDMEIIHDLALKIWTEHYSAILPDGQTEYMVEQFQSADAVCKQIKNSGYEYFIFVCNSENVGYMGIQKQENTLFLSKLYLDKAFRGKGISSCAFEYLEGLCRNTGLSKIWLTVNKHNETSISIYRKRGFVISDTQVSDIGNGYVMDDYIMEKTIK